MDADVKRLDVRIYWRKSPHLLRYNWIT